MPILKNDIEELRRMFTNTNSDADKNFLNRVIVGIAEMEREISILKGELNNLNKANKAGD